MSENAFLNFFDNMNTNFNNLKKQISKKIDLNEDYEYKFIEENNVHIVEILLNDKIQMRAEYNIIGMYNLPLSVWYWGWNIAFVNKKLIEKLNDLKNFIEVLEKNYKDFNKREAEEIYYLLSNGNFYISSNNIEKLIKLTLYLTNSIWYFPLKYTAKYSPGTTKTNSDEMDKTDYIIITKILQYF